MKPLLKRLWTERLAPAFAIDLRTLALFRFLLSSVLLVDTLRRLADVRAFYTDAGVLPRAVAAENGGLWRFSLHMANGEWGFQAALILLQALAALALAVGYRTRLAALAAWVLTLSICNRNPLVLIGGDYLMCCLLFWSLFLPLGARWSVDAALAKNPPPRDHTHLSWASAGLILQVLSVYLFSALLKTGPEWWPQMSAVYFALSLDSYVYTPGRWLLQYPEAMRALTGWVWWLELLGPLLVLAPRLTQGSQQFIRTAVMVQLALFHVGLIFTLAIGHFPFVSLASLSVLLGGWFWDHRARKLEPGKGLRIYYDRDCAFCLKSVKLYRELFVLPQAQLLPAQDNRRADALMRANNSWVVIDRDDTAHLKWAAFVVLLKRSPLLAGLGRLLSMARFNAPGDAAYDFVARNRGAFGRVTARLLPEREERYAPGWIAQKFCAVMLFAVLAWNLVTVHALPQGVMRLLTPGFFALRIDQIWDMFAPYPLKDDGWWVAPGKLADGREIDVLHPDDDRAPRYDKPADLASQHRNFRWHIYELRMWEARFSAYRLHWGRYLCREWNGGLDAGSPDRLNEFRLVYLLENTKPPGLPQTIEQSVLWRHDCNGGVPPTPVKPQAPLPDKP